MSRRCYYPNIAWWLTHLSLTLGSGGSALRPAQNTIPQCQVGIAYAKAYRGTLEHRQPIANSVPLPSGRHASLKIQIRASCGTANPSYTRLSSYIRLVCGGSRDFQQILKLCRAGDWHVVTAAFSCSFFPLP